MHFWDDKLSYKYKRIFFLSTKVFNLCSSGKREKEREREHSPLYCLKKEIVIKGIGTNFRSNRGLSNK